MTDRIKEDNRQADEPRRDGNRKNDSLRRVHVLHVITQLELGGAQQNTLYTVKHLNGRKDTISSSSTEGMLRGDTERDAGRPDSDRYKVFLASNTRGMLRAEAEKIPGLKTFFLPELRREINPVLDLMALVKLYRICRDERIDIIHTHSSKAGILGRWAGRLARVPVIIHTVHGWGFNDYQPGIVKKAFIFLERLTARITHKLIVVSAANRDKGLSHGIGRPEQYTVIHSGIKIKEFNEAASIDMFEQKREQNKSNDTAQGKAEGEEGKKAEERKREGEKRAERRKEKKRALGLAADEPVVGMIACFKPQKAPLDFIKTAALVLKRAARMSMPLPRFLLAGDGILRPRIEALIDELDLESEKESEAEPGGEDKIKARDKEKGNTGIKDRIILLGWRDDIPAIMEVLDILVLTSLWEGLPRVFPEAMAAGKPIVAANVDGAPEAVVDGQTGFLVQPHDIQAFAERIITLLENKALAQNMGAEGRRLVYPDFDIDVMVAKISALYREMSAQKKLPKTSKKT